MLRDVLCENLDVVFCGTAKGEASVRLGYYYAGPGNKFYGILYEAGFIPRKLQPSECYTINDYKIGLTDLVHNQCGNDDVIDDENYDAEGFISKIEIYQPRYVAFTSKKAASFALGFKGATGVFEYGLYKQKIGKSDVFILPSTSGSARRFWDKSFWFQLSQLIKAHI